MQSDSKRWSVVLGATLALIVSQGPINVFAAGVFLKPLSQDLGFGRGEISTAIGLANLMSAVATPLFGRLIDLRGVRGPVAVSIVLYAFAIALLAVTPHSVFALYALFALVGFVGVGQNPGPYSKVLTSWFDRRRGLALGIALAGVGIGTTIIPVVSNALISNFGWRVGYVGLACVVLALALVPVLLFIREPVRQEATRSLSMLSPALDLPGMTMSQAVRDWRFWSILIGFFLSVVAINGSLVHVVPMLTDRGVPLPKAIAIISSSGIALIVGRLFAGWIIDRVFAPYVAVFFLICPLVGLAILAGDSTAISPIVGVILLGLGIGAETDLLSYMVSRYFGVRHFGTIYGWIFTAALVGNALGSTILGWTFQLYHSYTGALIGFCLLLVLSSLLMARLGSYRYPPGETDASVPLALGVSSPRR